MRVLIACEYSGIVRDAFRAKGHFAVSCDILPTESTGYHYQGNVLDILNDGWDMMIAHPPCTYLCLGGLTWINREPGRREKMIEAASFVKKLMDAPIPKIAIENPIGKISTLIRKPDQIVRAYQFGHPFSKYACFWLKALPKLQYTNILPPPYKTYDFWSTERHTEKGGYKKSMTFQGIADAMADQWGEFKEMPEQQILFSL